MQPFQCDLQPEIPKHPITTHTQAHPKQLQATVTQRQKKTTNRPQPQPSHTRGTLHRRLQPLYTKKHKVSCSGFLPKTRPMQHHAAITMRFAASTRKLAPIYAHTSTPKAASSHRYTVAKKRQTDRSRTRRTHEVPFIVACSHFTRKNTRCRAPASSPKHGPCNIMQPLQCGSQHQLANLHLCTHRTTAEHQMTTVMQPFQCDLQPEIPKHPLTTHTQAHPKQLQATVTLRQKKKRQTDRSRTRHTHEVPFIVACSHFTRKNTRFRAPASSPKHSPCNIMQPLQCGSQHQLANLHLSTHRTTAEHQMTTVMQPFQCDLQPEIPKHLITTHTQAHPKQLQATVTPRQKKRQTDRSRTRRTHEVPFTVACSHFRRKNTRFRAPVSSPARHLPSSPLPFLTTSHRHHLASSPLPFVTTSLRHHFPSSPLPFVTTSLRHHFPWSPLPFITTSLRHHFPSSPPVIITTLHQGQFHRFLLFCYVLFCDLPPFILSSRRILFVRNTEVLLPNFLWWCNFHQFRWKKGALSL